MKIMDEILGILKNNPVQIEDLKVASRLPDDKFDVAIDFLRDQNFIEIKNNQVRITASGLSFLELPVGEQLYKDDKLKAAENERKAMAERLGITEKDVIYAAWEHSKGVIGARLKRDLKDKEKQKKTKNT